MNLKKKIAKLESKLESLKEKAKVQIHIENFVFFNGIEATIRMIDQIQFKGIFAFWSKRQWIKMAMRSDQRWGEYIVSQKRI